MRRPLLQWRPRARRVRRLPRGASESLQRLHAAWLLAAQSEASAPGKAMAYYGLEFDGYWLSGERPWDDRWAYLRDAMDYRDKRVIELGCNLGLLSVWLMKEGGAAAVLGVDADDQILLAASVVADVFQVAPEFMQVDLDRDADWEESLSRFGPEVVFVLNVLNWLEDKQRTIKFLETIPVVIYEGHDDIDIESQRLRSAGFSLVEVVALSERGRAVLRATRS